MATPNKESPSNTIIMLLSAFLLTGLLIYSYKFLPPRERVLVPGKDLVSHYADTTGSTQFRWLSEKERKFRCSYSAGSRFCGLDIQQGNGQYEGVDLSKFQKFEVNIKYSGNAKVMRFYLRNFRPNNLGSASDESETKYINTLIPVSELNGPLSIHFDEFALPEWWIVTSNIPRELSYTEFNNVVHLGIDIPSPSAHGNHDLELVSLTVSGIYLSKDTWYLIILTAWATVLFFIAVRRDVHIRKTAHMSSQHLAIERIKSKRLKRVSDKYKELAILDTLTGVFNRRGIYQFYENCFDNNTDIEGSIIMIDIDHFKNINDTHGHDAGDNVIGAIGQILLNSVREQDSVGRWGGEEFIVLCVNTDIDGASFMAEKIRESVELHRFDDLPELNITVSLGISTISPKLKFEENIKFADEALYRAKQNGRNCWVTSGE